MRAAAHHALADPGQHAAGLDGSQQGQVFISGCGSKLSSPGFLPHPYGPVGLRELAQAMKAGFLMPVLRDRYRLCGRTTATLYLQSRNLLVVAELGRATHQAHPFCCHWPQAQ